MTSKLIKDLVIDQVDYDNAKHRLERENILDIIRKLSLDDVLIYLKVEMETKKRMDHCRRLYQRYRYLYWYEVDKEYIEMCGLYNVKIPFYIRKSFGIGKGV
jgi:hypothetical protein